MDNHNIFSRLASLLIMTMMSVAAASADTVKVTDLSVAPGETKTVSINVSIGAAMETEVFCCRVLLPEGISFVQQTAEGAEEAEYGEFSSFAIIHGGKSVVMQQDGSLMIMAYGVDYPGGDGVMASFNIAIGEGFTEDDIVLTEVMLGPADLDDVNVHVKAVTNGVSVVPSVDVPAAAYSVSGVQVEPKSRGIVIVNGKKSVNKD